MWSLFSSKAEDSEPIYYNQSYDYHAINNSDLASPLEEENDNTKEHEVKIEVEKQQEEATLEGPHGETNATPDQVSQQEEVNNEEIEDKEEREDEKEEDSKGEESKKTIAVAGNQEGSSEGTEASTETMSSVATSAEADDPPTKSRCCHVTSALIAFVFLVICCFPIGLYISCFFGDKEHFLRFLGHMSYRPSLVLPPLIIFVAAFKAPEDPYTSWDNVFVLSTSIFKNKWKEVKHNTLRGLICSTLVIYVIVPLLVVIVKIIFFATAPKQCRGFFLAVWLGTEICGVVFFFTFCWFLYLQRLVVQEASKEASGLMCHNESQFRHCISSITIFFKEYYPLRSLMLPLVYIFLFESSFGIGSFLTWHYQHGDPSNGTSYTTIQPNWADNSYVCPINCPALDFNHLKSSVPYNLWIVSRHIMTILLPYWSASGMDMKYIWDDFRTKCTYKYSEEHESFWRKITAYMNGLHPKTSTYTVLTIIVPLLALVAGIFTGNQF